LVPWPLASEGNRKKGHQESCPCDETGNFQRGRRCDPGHGGPFQTREHYDDEDCGIVPAQDPECLVFALHPAVVQPGHDVRGELETAL